MTAPIYGVAPPGLYGWDRIVAGARFLGHLDPGWWQEGALVPASLAALDMADPYRCVLAWWAAEHLPAAPSRRAEHLPAAPSRRAEHLPAALSRRAARQVAPYDRAVRALRLSSREAEALGFTGVDADLLTPGWRHLIICLRTSHDHASRAGESWAGTAVRDEPVGPGRADQADAAGGGWRISARACSDAGRSA